MRNWWGSFFSSWFFSASSAALFLSSSSCTYVSKTIVRFSTRDFSAAKQIRWLLRDSFWTGQDRRDVFSLKGSRYQQLYSWWYSWEEQCSICWGGGGLILLWCLSTPKFLLTPHWFSQKYIADPPLVLPQIEYWEREAQTKKLLWSTQYYTSCTLCCTSSYICQTSRHNSFIMLYTMYKIVHRAACTHHVQWWIEDEGVPVS